MARLLFHRCVSLLVSDSARCDEEERNFPADNGALNIIESIDAPEDASGSAYSSTTKGYKAMRSMIPALAATGLLGMTLLLGTSPSQAQTTKTKPPHAHEPRHTPKPGHAHKAGHVRKPAHVHQAMHAMYECTHCKVMTKKAGNCPVCKMKMTKASATTVKKAQYGCSHCKIMSAKGDKCPVCKMEMKKMSNPAKS